MNRRIVSIALTVVACVTSLPAMGEPTGQELFGEKCGMCHRERGMGTLRLLRRVPEAMSLLENRDAVPQALTLTVVRNGIGIMFPLSRAEVSDEQLRRIAAYLAKMPGE